MRLKSRKMIASAKMITIVIMAIAKALKPLIVAEGVGVGATELISTC